MEVGGQLHTPTALRPGEEEPSTPIGLGGWVVLRACPDAVAKRNIFLLLLELETRSSIP
jgi:hypothetical protein